MNTGMRVLIVLAVAALAYSVWAEYWRVQAYKRIASQPPGAVIVELPPSSTGDRPLTVQIEKEKQP